MPHNKRDTMDKQHVLPNHYSQKLREIREQRRKETQWMTAIATFSAFAILYFLSHYIVWLA